MSDDEHNGLFFGDSGIRFRQVTDGLSKTIAVGERRSDLFLESDAFDRLTDTAGQNAYDYWNIGSPQIGGANGSRNEWTEFAGSTAVPINQLFDPAVTSRASTDQVEISFGSFHFGGAQFVMADASVRFIPDDVEMEVYIAYGSRNAGTDIEEPPTPPVFTPNPGNPFF